MFHREYRSERSSAGRVEPSVHEWKGMASLSYPPMPPILSLVVIFILVYLIDTSKLRLVEFYLLFMHSHTGPIFFSECLTLMKLYVELLELNSL